MTFFLKVKLENHLQPSGYTTKTLETVNSDPNIPRCSIGTYQRLSEPY